MINNEDFSSDDIWNEEDIIKLLHWQMKQIVRTTTAELSVLTSSTREKEQYLIAQKGLLRLISTKVKILEIQEGAHFIDKWVEE